MAQRSTPWKSQVKSEATANTFLGTPSLAMDGSGVLWCSFNYFGFATSLNTTDVYKSTNDGTSWAFVRQITGLYHGKYFIHGGDHYILGPAGNKGDLKLFYSTDEWATAPSSITVASGFYVNSSQGYLEKDGYLFFAVNETGSSTPSFADDYDLEVVFGDTTDLTNASNWYASNKLSFNQAWAGTAEVANKRGFIEGNVVEDGSNIVVVARVGYGGDNDTAGLITTTWNSGTPSLTLAFNDSTGFIGVPGGAKQFTLNYDSTASRWYSLGNYDGYGILDASSQIANISGLFTPNSVRQELWLSSASTLSGTWTKHCRVLRDEIEVTLREATLVTGFQYPSSVKDGTKLRFLSRTAYDGAANEHDSNRVTYHEISDIDKLISTQTASTLTPANWAGYSTYTVASADVGSSLTDFPLLIDLADITDSEFWANVREDGGDIRVSDSSNTEVPYHLIEFCRQSQVGRLICKIDLSSSVDTDVRIWVGNASVQGYAASDTYGSDNVFDSSHLYALEVNGIESPDMTGKVGTVNPTSGSLSRRVDYYQYFVNQSGSRYYTVTHDADLSHDVASGFTIEAVIDQDDVSGADTFDTTNPRYILIKGLIATLNYGLRILGTKLDFIYRNSANTAYVIQRQTTGTIGTSANHHVAVTHSGTAIKLYVDGSEVASSTASGTVTNSSITNTDDMLIGAQEAAFRQYEGTIHSVRIHSTARSADWISASSHSLESPSTFAAFQSGFTNPATGETGTASESLTLTDAAINVLATTQTASETLTLTDATSNVIETAQAAADSLVLTDAATAEVVGPGTETGAAADSLTLTDATSVQLASVPVLSESLSLTDATAGVIATAQTVSESLTLTDTVTAAVGITPAIASDTLTLTDSTTVLASLVASAAETLTLTDAVSATLATSETINETLSFSVTASASSSADQAATFIRVQSATIGVAKATGTIIA